MSHEPIQFVKYEPGNGGAPALQISIRTAVPSDSESIARLDADQYHYDWRQVEPHVRREVHAIAFGNVSMHCSVGWKAEQCP